MSNDLNLLKINKIVVLGGQITWNHERHDLILRITSDFLEKNNIIKAIIEGSITINEATIQQKEYWFLCHDNANVDFGVCYVESFNKWINNEI
jgi:hypothetical protein